MPSCYFFFFVLLSRMWSFLSGVRKVFSENEDVNTVELESNIILFSTLFLPARKRKNNPLWHMGEPPAAVGCCREYRETENTPDRPPATSPRQSR